MSDPFVKIGLITPLLMKGSEEPSKPSPPEPEPKTRWERIKRSLRKIYYFWEN